MKGMTPIDPCLGVFSHLYLVVKSIIENEVYLVQFPQLHLLYR